MLGQGSAHTQPTDKRFLGGLGPIAAPSIHRAEACYERKRLLTGTTQPLFPTTTGAQTCHHAHTNTVVGQNNGQKGYRQCERRGMGMGMGARPFREAMGGATTHARRILVAFSGL